MKKNILTAIVALMLSLALVACSAPAANETTAGTDKTPTTTEAPKEAETTAAPVETQAPAVAEISGMMDGQFTITTAVGYGGNMTVVTTFKDGKIASVEIQKHVERQSYVDQVVANMIPAILENQTTSVDTVAGATLTSYAVLEAVNTSIGMAGGTITITEDNPLYNLDLLRGYHDVQGLDADEREEAIKAKNQYAQIEYTPERQVLESGVVVQKMPYDRFAYNTTILHAEERGCNACHRLEDAVQSMAISHPQLLMTYNVEMNYNNCLPCHISRNPVRVSIHSIHEFSDTFNAMGGNCLSCHHVDGGTGTYTLWDDVKYSVMQGFTTLNKVEGEFSYDQDVLSEMEDTFWYWGNGNNRGYQPNYSDNQEIFDQWTITITGQVEEEVVLSLKELAAENSVTQVMKISCNVNQVGGSLIGNWEVTGIPVSYVLEKAQIKEGADGVQFVSDDRWNVGSVAMDFLTEWPTESLLVYKVNGEYISPEHGYPVQLMMPSSSAASFTKRVNEIRITKGVATTGRMAGCKDPAGGWFNKPNASIFYYEQGQIFDLGETITFNGFADAFDEKIVAVEFSLDMGKTWTRFEVPECDTEKWVYWTLDYKPATAGSYCLYVQAISETGLVSPKPGKLMFNVE